MNKQCKVPTTVAVLALTAAGMMPADAHAQGSMDGVKWEVSVYGWVPAIGLSAVIRDQGEPDLDLSKKQVLENLKMAFFGTLEARMGQYGFLTDVAYADLGRSEYTERDFDITGPADAVVTGKIGLDVKATLWTLAGTYKVIDSPDHLADLVLGARLNDLNNTVDYDLMVKVGPVTSTRAGRAKDLKSYWDGIVGFKGRARFGADRKWFVPYYADVGTGQSKLTWQVQAGVGYDLAWGSIIATWRHVAYEFDANPGLKSVDFGGPTIGMAFRF